MDGYALEVLREISALAGASPAAEIIREFVHRVQLARDEAT